MGGEDRRVYDSSRKVSTRDIFNLNQIVVSFNSKTRRLGYKKGGKERVSNS